MRHCDRSALRPPGVGPVYEVADVLAGARAFGEVLVNVNLLEAVSDRIVLLEKPPKELASLGDLLLRGQSRRAHVFGASVDLLAEVLQMVPAHTHALVESFGLAAASIADEEGRDRGAVSADMFASG